MTTTDTPESVAARLRCASLADRTLYGEDAGKLYDEAADRIQELEASDRAQAAEIARLSAEVTRQDAICLQVIDQRDMAEKALGNLFAMVTGRPPEWSNLFGYSEALDEAEAALAASEAKGQAMREALELAQRSLISLCPTGGQKALAAIRAALSTGATTPQADEAHIYEAAGAGIQAAADDRERYAAGVLAQADSEGGGHA